MSLRHRYSDHHAITPGNRKDTLVGLVFSTIRIFSAAIGDDFDLKHQHVLKAVLKPLGPGQGARSKLAPPSLTLQTGQTGLKRPV